MFTIQQEFRPQDIIELAKPRLASSVVFSAVAGYLIGYKVFNLWSLTLLAIGGFMVVAASNAFNQAWEKQRDSRMERTKNRPIASNRMSSSYGIFLASLMLILGLTSLWLINPLSAIFGLASTMLYVLVYTPLKAHGPLAVFVGAIPGAIPFMLGWVAARNDFDLEAGTLFAIQFVWQFPHFWAIAWMLHDDYAKANYNLLPSGKRDSVSAFQILFYCIALIPLSLLPAVGLTKTLVLSPLGFFVATIIGGFLVYRAIEFFNQRTVKSAKRLMLTSVLWLTLYQLVLVTNKLFLDLWGN